MSATVGKYNSAFSYSHIHPTLPFTSGVTINCKINGSEFSNLKMLQIV